MCQIQYPAFLPERTFCTWGCQIGTSPGAFTVTGQSITMHDMAFQLSLIDYYKCGSREGFCSFI